MRALIMRSSSMGDIIHALPVAYDIHQYRPDVTIVWAVEKAFESIVDLSPFVHEKIVSDFRGWRRHLWESWPEFQAYRQAMKTSHVDVVLDIQGTMRSAYMSSLAPAPIWGYGPGQRRERLAGLVYQHTWDLPPSIPAVTRYRRAAALTLGYDIGESKPTFGLKAVASPSLRLESPYAAFCVNTSRDDKYWDPKHWQALARHVWQQYGLISVFFYGNDRELAIVQAITDGLDHVAIAPKASLAATASTLAGAKLLVGVDTGLTHLGAALGLPSVGIFVSTPIERVALVGDGPRLSLGDNPSFEAVAQAVRDVLISQG